MSVYETLVGPPYSIALSILWTLFLLAFWALGIPLGFGASFYYPAA